MVEPVTADLRLATLLGGGTDLYVQKHDEMTYADIRFVFDDVELNGITQEGNKCFIGPSANRDGSERFACHQQCFSKLSSICQISFFYTNPEYGHHRRKFY